jgi:hypothetical protein
MSINKKEKTVVSRIMLRLLNQIPVKDSSGRIMNIDGDKLLV